MNIQTISLRDVVISGRHGATDAEREAGQAFSVDLDISFDASAALSTGHLENTIDYYDLVRVLKKHIENDSEHVLLETLVETISTDIAAMFSCTRLKIFIRKPQVPFHPGIGLTRTYFSQRGTVPMKSFEQIHAELVSTGAVSTPFLTDNERRLLLKRSQSLDLVRQPEHAATGTVREDLSFCRVTSEASPLFHMGDRCALFLSELAEATGGSLSVSSFEVSIQKYDKGSFGITPHRDEKKYRHAVCNIALEGQGTLSLCDDRQGTNARVIDTTPGNLVLLRASGYAGMQSRPMHQVTDIASERTVLGVRFVV